MEFYGTGTTEHHLKGLSYEIDFKNVDENLQVLALKVHKIEIFLVSILKFVLFLC